MRACIQRVQWAKVTLPESNHEVAGEIGPGFLVLLGVGANDGRKELDLLARKVASLRIFEDANGKMNLDIRQMGGKMLIVSQFTLYADCVRGNRPGFTAAAAPDRAHELYVQFCEEIRSRGIPVEQGRFRADMHVQLLNDGPVTIWLDTDSL